MPNPTIAIHEAARLMGISTRQLRKIRGRLEAEGMPAPLPWSRTIQWDRAAFLAWRNAKAGITPSSAP